MPESFAAPRWRLDLARTAATGLGGLAALAIAGWPRGAALTAGVAAVGATIGLLVALGVEWVGRLRREVIRLQDVERSGEAEREQAGRLRHHLEYQLQVAKREAALNGVHMKVYSDAFLEVEGVKRIPFDAILARLDVSTRAQNLQLPIERPKI